MIVLPVIIVCQFMINFFQKKIFFSLYQKCIWWQKSARYAGDQILSDTVQIYLHFLSRTSSIVIKRKFRID
jgi:hypothetical protein